MARGPLLAYQWLEVHCLGYTLEVKHSCTQDIREEVSEEVGPGDSGFVRTLKEKRSRKGELTGESISLVPRPWLLSLAGRPARGGGGKVWARD